jgi:hypothetical protein
MRRSPFLLHGECGRRRPSGTGPLSRGLKEIGRCNMKFLITMPRMPEERLRKA